MRRVCMYCSREEPVVPFDPTCQAEGYVYCDFAAVAPPNDSRLPVRSCAICGSAEGVRRFAVTVDGDELRAVAELCGEHGDAHLLNVGRVLGELFARKGSSRS